MQPPLSTDAPLALLLPRSLRGYRFWMLAVLMLTVEMPA